MNKTFTCILVAAFASSAFAQDLSDATCTKIGDDQIIVYPLPDDMGFHKIYSGKDHDSYLVLPIVN